MPIITLLTDFGLADEYVGVVKGVILSMLPQARVVDISHGIAPQDVRQAACMLPAAYPYFEPGTIHVVVVDPGVGTRRRIVCADVDGHLFLAPDNGVLSLLTSGGREAKIVQVENPKYFRQSVGQTFHGRDIFAPVAAHLAGGLAVDELGRTLAAADLMFLSDVEPHRTEGGNWSGCVVSVDRFGNLITNIPARLLTDDQSAFEMERIAADVDGRRIPGSRFPYSHHPGGKAFVLVNSRGYFEIAVNRSSAASLLKVQSGETVVIRKT